MRGAEGLLEEVCVVVGNRVEWADCRNDAKLITRVINPVGPAGGQGVGATREAPKKPPTPPPQNSTLAEYDGPISNPRPPHPDHQHPSQSTSPTLLEVSHPMATKEHLA